MYMLRHVRKNAMCKIIVMHYLYELIHHLSLNALKLYVFANVYMLLIEIRYQN